MNNIKKITTIFLFLLYLSTYFQVSAQRLKPKGTLGITYEEASDSLMRSLRGLDTRGILVKSIKSGATASNMGIQSGDVIVSVNNIDSLYLYDFAELVKKLKENEPISITYVRNRRKARVVGNVTTRSREQSAYADVIYDEVAYGRGFLRSIMHKPTGSGRFPAVFYIQNYDCSSIDFSSDSASTTRQLIDGWVKAGFAVFRIEKPGVGDSEGTKGCASLSYLEELKAFENGFRTLKKNKFIDSTKVFLFGHSLGGITAPLLAAKANIKPRGIMTYGTVVKPWFEYMIDVFREQPLLFKESQQSVDANTRMMTPLLAEWLIAGKTGGELVQNPDFEAILTSNENPLQYQKGMFFGRTATFFYELNQQSIATAWAQAAVPTLAIHGEIDAVAISPRAAQTIAAIVNEVKPGKGTFKVLKGTDNYFTKVSSYQEQQKIMDSGKYFSQYSPTHFNPEIIEITTTWMRQN